MAGERILIADDEPDVLEVARFTLELAGYQVTPVTDGVQAVEEARRNPYALFLTDIKMPFMDGLDAFQEIRRLDPAIIGVAMTGYGTMTIAVQAIKRGFSDFVVKPFGPDELTDAVARTLEKERLRRENFRLKALIPLFELSRVFMTETQLPALLERVVQTAVAETGAIGATLLLLSPDGQFRVAAHTGKRLEFSEEWRRLADWLLRSRQPLVLDSGVNVLPFQSQPIQAHGSVLALPLFNKEREVGVLLLEKRETDPRFGDVDAELLNVLAGQAAVAIENARLFEERQEAYRELEKMDHMKSEFINIAAHELRTPLSLVLGYAGLLEEETDGVGREYAHHITENAMRLRAIMDDMTNLRYLELRQIEVDSTSMDLRDLILEAVEARPSFTTRDDIQVVTTLPNEPLLVVADGEKLKLVLANLLSNACKFSPPRGTVTVTAQAGQSDIHVSVTDQGIGIPTTELTKIWKRFYQVEDSLTRVHGGLGLGLAIVKDLVELHRGRVWAESSEGQGSTFYFTIPRGNTSK